MEEDATLDETLPPGGGVSATRKRGLLLVHSEGAPHAVPLPLPRSGRLDLGRGGALGGLARDRRISRPPAEVRCVGEPLTLVDCASRNGTFVNGLAAEGSVALRDGDIVRLGSAVL